MVDGVSTTRLQLRRAADRHQPPAPVGSETPGRSGPEVRMTTLTPSMSERRGNVGVLCLITAEAAIFTIFVVGYLYYIGKSVSGPQPADVLRAPIALTICLLSSSVTVHAA